MSSVNHVSSSLAVFHYQVKVHFFSKDPLSFTEQPIKVSLYGTHGEKEDIAHVLYVFYIVLIPQNMPGMFPCRGQPKLTTQPLTIVLPSMLQAGHEW